MNKIVEYFLLPLFVVISLMYAIQSCGKDIEITKVFHHRSDNMMHLECGDISFYFSGEPTVREVNSAKKEKGGIISKTFFLPHVVINKTERDAMIGRIHQPNTFYTVKVKEVTKPTKGLEIIFDFDPKKVGLSYDLFDSIGLQKGIVFRLCNKELLHQLEKNHNQPILRTLWHDHKPPCIVIDPGHGGSDSGAMVLDDSIREKEVCLAIGIDVAQLLQEQGYTVVLTRNKDCTMLLDERSLCANNNDADLFVSIHANYASKNTIMGVETFCMQPHLFKESFSYLSDSELPLVLKSINQKYNASHNLARSVQQHLCDAISSYHLSSVDRKVKFSVTQVLLGTQMPSVLVEVGFLSNKQESHLLSSKAYQKTIARGICDGIVAIFSC